MTKEQHVYISILAFGMYGSVVRACLGDTVPGIAMGIVQAWECAIIFIMAQTFPYMVDGIGNAWTFLILTGFCRFGIVYIAIWVKETKDKNAVEIAEMYWTKKPQDNLEEKSLLIAKEEE